MNIILRPNRFRIYAAALFCLGLMACATEVRVRSTAAPGVNLAQYTTYALASHPPDPSDVTKTEIAQVLESEVIAQLAAHGLHAVAQGSQLTFSYETQRTTGYAGENRWKYQEGTLSLAAADAQGNLVWQSQAHTVIDPAKKDYQQLKMAIRKAFKDYPKATSN